MSVLRGHGRAMIRIPDGFYLRLKIWQFSTGNSSCLLLRSTCKRTVLKRPAGCVATHFDLARICICIVMLTEPLMGFAHGLLYGFTSKGVVVLLSAI